MKKVSKTRAQQLRIYKKLRDQYLTYNPRCEIPIDGCMIEATEVHHTRGREGRRLIEAQYFKAACNHCHRWVTDHSREAVEMGYSVKRGIKTLV